MTIKKFGLIASCNNDIVQIVDQSGVTCFMSNMEDIPSKWTLEQVLTLYKISTIDHSTSVYNAAFPS